MPEEGVSILPHKEILTFDEIIRLCSSFAHLGINKVKITGGEPLVRKDVVELIGWIKCLEGIQSVTLTTNGVKLKEHLPNLIKNGLDGVNISLDTLDPLRFAEVTRMNALQDVLAGIYEALKYPNLKVKINCVLMNNSSQEDILSIANLAKSSRLTVRFIEIMPIGLGKNYTYYSEDKVIELLKDAFGNLEFCDEMLGNGPAHYYTIPGFKGKIGFISAITHQFCEECNRIRLTSDGFLKTCLHYEKGADLKTLLRSGTDDALLEQVIRQAIEDKPVSHNFKDSSRQGSYERGHMSQIGG
jgi:cyclic pyranopterin phosphate synthase